MNGVFNLNFPEELQFSSFSNQRHNLPKCVENGKIKGYSNVNSIFSVPSLKTFLDEV